MYTGIVIGVSLVAVAWRAWSRMKREERERRAWLWCHNKPEYYRIYGEE